MKDKKPKNAKPDDPEESARFIETMEKLDLVDDPKKAFEDTLKKIARQKPKPKKK